MDIYSQLKGEHDELRRLMEQIGDEESKSSKNRAAAFQDFRLALLVHSKVEEAVFYSQLKYVAELKTSELEAENEHRVAGLLLDELGTMPDKNPEWKAKFIMLKELLEHHIEEEETELFEKARQALSEELAEDLGTRMRNRSLVVKAALQPIPAAEGP